MSDGTVGVAQAGSPDRLIDNEVVDTDKYRQRVRIAGATYTDLVDASVANGLEVDVTRVQGVVSVDDNGASLTVDGSVSLAAALPAGTNNIGDVDVASLPANASVNVAQTGGTATVTAGAGRAQVASRPVATHPIDTSGITVTIKTVTVNATADGDNTVISAVAGKQIWILGYVLSGNAVGTILMKDGTTEKGRLYVSATGGASYKGGLDAPAIIGSTNTAVVINNSTGLDTGGHITYIEV